MIEVRELEPGGQAAWKRFVEESNNGTLFHDLDFLAYHPPGKFRTCHLVFSEAGETIAVMPAAVEDGILKSPYGASVEGWCCPPAIPRRKRVKLSQNCIILPSITAFFASKCASARLRTRGTRMTTSALRSSPKTSASSAATSAISLLCPPS